MADNKMTKSAGEHWVCSVLARLGWGAALTRDGLERTDILAVHGLPPRMMVEIQVKTANDRGDSSNWIIGAKAQQASISYFEWFVFVLLSAGNPFPAPRTFIVPRDHVSAAAWIVHQAWLTDPDVEPGKRTTTVDKARVNVSAWAGYENRWDLLSFPTNLVPVLLPAKLRGLAQQKRVGLPIDHPWNSNLPSW